MVLKGILERFVTGTNWAINRNFFYPWTLCFCMSRIGNYENQKKYRPFHKKLVSQAGVTCTPSSIITDSEALVKTVIISFFASEENR